MPKKENTYRFDAVVVDRENFRVQKNGRAITLTPRAFDVLMFLLENGGHVVEKQDIFEAVWKDTFVGDNSLTKVIKEIRHALDDSAAEPRYIETVPKRGYRFIHDILAEPTAAVHDSETTRASDMTASPPASFSKSIWMFSIVVFVLALSLAGWWIFRERYAAAPSTPIRSIAVLPFKPLDANSRDESLEMGMAETLITRMSTLRELAVRPIGSVRKFTDPGYDPVAAGKEMQVGAVLDGSIQKSGDRVRMTVRLIDVKKGQPLWSEQFDERFTDIFSVQDAIAERVTNSLALRLSRQEQEQLAKHYTDDPEAYQFYLNAQLVWHGRRQNWIRQSFAFYKQAVEKDPNFALAYIGIADAYIMLNGHHHIRAEEAEKNARPAIIKALEIDDTLAQAHNALAELKYQYEYDWKGAGEEFKRAIELNPNVAWIRQAHGWYLMSLGRFDEAGAEMALAHELDPSSITVNVGRGRLFYYSRQYDEAIRHFQNLIAVEPNDSSLFNALFTIYAQKGAYEDAVESYLTVVRLSGASPEKLEHFREIYRSSGWEGFLRARLERHEKDAADGHTDFPVSLADLYVALGEKEKALFWLDRGVDAREPSVIQLKIEPAYDELRDDPRFAELLRKIGLQP